MGNTKINPMMLMQMKGMYEQFQNNHPRIVPFLNAASEAVDEGSVISVEMTTSEGKKLYTNIRVNASDMEMIRNRVGGGD
ncbi:MAG: hypothetical protein LIO94_02015 [Clostridiales bacterium]|nr:hypothetical protein [Clostridiales bacterium]